MKTLTIDKIYHFFITYGITLVGALVLNGFSIETDRALAISSLVAFLAGTGKELYDKYIKKTKFDNIDMVADIAGIMSAVFPSVIL